MGPLTLGIDSSRMQLAMQVKSPIHSYDQGGDLTMKPCPRGEAFDFKNSQIPTLPQGGTNIGRCIRAMYIIISSRISNKATVTKFIVSCLPLHAHLYPPTK